MIFVLLDLAAVFDTVDHKILGAWLQHLVALCGSTLDWFRSYLVKRTMCVSFAGFKSFPAPLYYGDAQGSVLEPLLFSSYLLPLSFIPWRHGIFFLSYANNSQMYSMCHWKKKDAFSLKPFLVCLEDIKAWMCSTMESVSLPFDCPVCPIWQLVRESASNSGLPLLAACTTWSSFKNIF